MRFTRGCDLVRARAAAVDDRRRKRQQLLSFLLRHGRVYSGRRHWTLAHWRIGALAHWRIGAGWQSRALIMTAQQIVFQEAVDAIEDAVQRRSRLEQQLVQIVPSRSMAPVVEGDSGPRLWSR